MPDFVAARPAAPPASQAPLLGLAEVAVARCGYCTVTRLRLSFESRSTSLLYGSMPAS